MRILILHNEYLAAGGEDVVVRQESELLRAAGHEVRLLLATNQAALAGGRLRAALHTIWSLSSYRRVLAAVREFRPDVAHVHNTFFAWSPSVLAALNRAGVPVVQTLHNFRLICPGATLMRDNTVCTLCVGGLVPWRAVRYRCYRGSRAASFVVVLMLAVHRLLGTYRRQVRRFIVLSEGARDWFIKGGLPAERLEVKPNFTSDVPKPTEKRPFAVLVARLDHSKGIMVALEAWRRPGMPPLEIIGEGPLRAEAEEMIRMHRLPVTLVGQLPREAVLDRIAAATLLVLPSIWFEGLPLVLVESFAAGTPAIASRLGAPAEMIRDGENGLLAEPGNASALADAVLRLNGDVGLQRRLAAAARSVWQAQYAPAVNLARLEAIYRV